MTVAQLDPVTQTNVNEWLNGRYDDATKAEIRSMLEKDPKAIQDAFFTKLSFGTAGLRGLMGVGSNRMNAYTVRAATQGLSNYILKQPKPDNDYHVFVGYDSRHHSREYAEETAKVLAGNGIHVYIYKEIRPTPLVSYGCRFKKCISAIMITASHNPPEYNGFKVYWADGAQIVPPHDTLIIDEVNKITNPSMVKMTSFDSPLIQEIATDVDDAYIKDIRTLQSYPDDNKKHGNELKIVYTSLHGTGITIVPRALKDWGFNNFIFVEKQVIPDGSFPTANYPNPEEKAAMQLGVDLLLKSKSDILVATDPDADRMGIAVRQGDKTTLLTGNQIVSICLEHICEALTKQNRFPKKAAFVKTIGTTELFQAICDAYHCPCFNVLTGFKYIGEKIHNWETQPNGYQYIFGGEESYGYLLGTYVRDKDAVVCSALISEVALQAKLQGKTLLDRLYDLYHKYGVFEEKTISVVFGETKEGKEQMAAGMDRLRKTGLKEIANIPVVAIEDYLQSTKSYLATGKKESLTLPVSDVLLYWLSDGSKVMIRPSGTEPKIKLSCGICEKNFQTIEAGINSAQKKCDTLLAALKQDLMKSSQ